MQLPNTSTVNGFTLLEILISLSIFTLVASLGLFVSMDFYRSYVFRSQSTMFLSALERARGRAMDNVHGSPHGVAIATTSYTIFQGSSYASRDASYDETYALGAGIVTSGLHEVRFDQLSGVSTASGSAILNDRIHTATISINYEGRISW